MKEVTCVVVGGGYAGINVVKTDVAIPLRSLFPEGVEFVQGTVTSIKGKERNLLYVDKAGNEQTLAYDMLDLGSRKRDSTSGARPGRHLLNRCRSCPADLGNLA